MATVIGVDFALKAGATAEVDFDPTTHKVLSFRPGPSWKNGPSSKDHPSHLIDYFMGVFDYFKVFRVTRRYIGIEWDPTEAFWGSKIPAVMKAFVLGSLYQYLLSIGNFPVTVAPQKLREALGLPARTSKEEMHDYFREHHIPEPSLDAWDDSGPDMKDAVIVAFALYHAITSALEEPHG